MNTLAMPAKKVKVPAPLLAAKSAVTVEETFIAENGNSYQRLSNGKVRRTYPDMPSDEELAELDAGTVKQRMTALYNLLRAEAPEETVRKGSKHTDFIHCRGYKMRYTRDGLEILDAHNYYKPSTKFDYTDDSAKAVAAFIFRRNLQKEVNQKPVVAAEPKAEPINRMREAITKDAENRARKIEKLKNPKVEKTLEEYRAEALALITQGLQKEVKPAAVLEVIQNLVPNRKLRVRLGKALRDAETKRTRTPKLLQELHALVSEVSFDDRKPAPKFHGVAFYDLLDLRESGPEHVSMQLRGQTARVTTTKSELLARYCLSENPQLMVLFMKVVSGEEYDLQDLYDVKFIIRDKYVEYNEKLFSRHEFHQHLYDVCEEYLLVYEILNPMNYVWGTTLNKGDRVRVSWLDHHTYHLGTVTSAHDGPVKIRYDLGGGVIPLFKHQPVKLLK